MDPRFFPHNSHLNDARRFAETDPQLRHLTECPYRHRSCLLDRLPASVAPDIGTNYLIVDEVTYVRDWDKAVKHAAD